MPVYALDASGVPAAGHLHAAGQEPVARAETGAQSKGRKIFRKILLLLQVVFSCDIAWPEAGKVFSICRGSANIRFHLYVFGELLAPCRYISVLLQKLLAICDMQSGFKK
ncbi:hypothetical protein ACE0DR_20805 [Azotobacter sp. CWF10]